MRAQELRARLSDGEIRYAVESGLVLRRRAEERGCPLAEHPLVIAGRILERIEQEKRAQALVARELER